MYRWIVIWTWLLGSAGMGYAQFQHETRQVFKLETQFLLTLLFIVLKMKIPGSICA